MFNTIKQSIVLMVISISSSFCSPSLSSNNDDLKAQQSFTSYDGALGPIIQFYDDKPQQKYFKNKDNDLSMIPVNFGDDLYKYGGIAGTKPLLLNDPGYHGYGDSSEHLDQGLNKNHKHYKQDKYGGKSDNLKDFNDHHVYQRNRGYGYEKHYAFDKEYSTGKKSGKKTGSHSYYGNHNHGSKSSLDMHKKYDSKKYGQSPIIDDVYDHSSSYNDDVEPNDYHHRIIPELNKMNLLKHKKEFLRKHFDKDNHYGENYHNHNHYNEPSIIQHNHNHLPSKIIDNYGYNTRLTPFLGTTYHHHHPHPHNHYHYESPIKTYNDHYSSINSYVPHTQHPQPQPQQQQSYFDNDDGFYLSSSNSNSKLLNKLQNNITIDTDTEGESINTMLPSNNYDHNINNINKDKKINLSPLISTRSTSSSSSSSSSSTSSIIKFDEPNTDKLKPLSQTVAESFQRIQSAVHATPPIIPTHLYRQL